MLVVQTSGEVGSAHPYLFDLVNYPRRLNHVPDTFHQVLLSLILR